MSSDLLLDIKALDFNHVLFDKTKIREFNPHRYEMEQLDAVIYLDVSKQIIVGYKDIKPDEFWVRGHIPGRPLFPGVLMIESAAQLSSIYYLYMIKEGLVAALPGKFIGFGGVDNVKFRGTVVPGDRFIILCKCLEIRPRRAILQAQGIVNDKLVFEAQIIGMPI